MPVSRGAGDPGDTLLAQSHSGAESAFQQQPIQRKAREDCQRMTQFKVRPAPGRTHQLAVHNELGFGARFAQKRILN